MDCFWAEFEKKAVSVKWLTDKLESGIKHRTATPTPQSVSHFSPIGSVVRSHIKQMSLPEITRNYAGKSRPEALRWLKLLKKIHPKK